MAFEEMGQELSGARGKRGNRVRDSARPLAGDMRDATSQAAADAQALGNPNAPFTLPAGRSQQFPSAAPSFPATTVSPGRAHLAAEPRQPKKYTPRGAKQAQILRGKVYRSRDHLVVIEKENEPDTVSRAILKACNAFEQKYATKWKGRHIKRPTDLERFVLWLYATGSREGEPFLKPYPKISILKPRNLPWKVVKITRPIEKSFTRTHEHEIIEQHIPIFDATEDALWRKILDDYESIDLDDLFERMSKHFYGKKGRSGNLSMIIQRNFRADQRTEQGELRRNAPILAHSLRHHRVYNWKLERELSDDLIANLIGWKRTAMVNYYAYLSRAIKEQAQLQALEAYAARNRPSILR